MRRILFLLLLPSLAFAAELPRSTPEAEGLDPAWLERAKTHALTGGGSGIVLRHGKVVMRWGDPDRRYDLKSTTKSIGFTAFGLAQAEGLMKLDDPARAHLPEVGTPPKNRADWLERLTLRHLARQTGGFDKPGGFARMVTAPGTTWHYSDAGPNWLADCITRATGRDLDALLFERVFEPIGITRKDLRWRGNAYRPRKLNGVERREIGSGISADVEAMARIGQLYLQGGRWGDRQLLPARFVAEVAAGESSGRPAREDRDRAAPAHYGLLWWNNRDGNIRGLPRDAYWSWGLYESLIVVVPSLDLVAARAGKSWQSKWGGDYDTIRPFLEPLGHAAARIAAIDWAPADTIRRGARGSDNWPLTWTADGEMIGAWGDGHGFAPKVEPKLSQGLARITGGPADWRGKNLRSKTFERTGDGARGPKTSGLLAVDGTIHAWVRNTGNSRLAWSEDGGTTWTWADWRFTESFGAPSFINEARAHAGRDFAYAVSFDSDTAYEPADRMVLARAPRDRIREREAWEFFVRRDGVDAVWSPDVSKRGAVLTDPGNCYRGGASWNPGLQRYLWAQVKGGRDTRFEGGLAIYEAAVPWGPWREVFRAVRWDVGPGESASFPVKWMSADGRRAQLVFSGDDSFSVRLATFRLRGVPREEDDEK